MSELNAKLNPYEKQRATGLRRWLSRENGRRATNAPPVEDAHDARDPRGFVPTEEGSGVFGRWIVDEYGLPAYRYEIDQHADARARYPNSEARDRRDHWHQIGNDRVTALASNDGDVQVYLWDRAGTFLNRRVTVTDDIESLFGGHRPDNGWMWLLSLAVAILRIFRQLRMSLERLMGLDPTTNPAQPFGPLASTPEDGSRVRARGVIPVPVAAKVEAEIQAQVLDLPIRKPRSAQTAFAGGFAYLDDGYEVWSTAYRYRPNGAEVKRVFGAGYFETTSLYRKLSIQRRVYAPSGDHPFVLADVTVENQGSKTVDLIYYEYWDVNVEQLKLQWLRTHPMGAAGDEERSEINEAFEPQIQWDASFNALRFHQTSKSQVLAGQIDSVNVVPPDIFLADLSGAPDSQFTDKFAFFGKGGAGQPDAVKARTVQTATQTIHSPGDPMPYCAVLRRTLRLEAGQQVRLRFAYGAITPADSLDPLGAFRDRDFFSATLDTWKAELPRFWTGQDPVLQRETAWHAYALLSSTLYNGYYDKHVVPQGSAYLYLHGADGVPRDQSLIIMGLTYVRPRLAREMLEFLMALQDYRTGALPYSYAGYGYQHGAVIHDSPSDLDLFFLLAMLEYLSATGDRAFLDVETPFYPPDRMALAPGANGNTTLDHIRVAILHLIQSVGLGEHGLIRIGDGDWSDGVVFDNATTLGGINAIGWFENTKANGESIMNTGMALYVLPRLARRLRDHDPMIVEQIEDFLGGMEAALNAQWSGQWYHRAVLRNEQNNAVVVGQAEINLEAQVWPLISGAARRAGTEDNLINTIHTLLDMPSPTGAATAPRGLVWPAISQLMTWGYTRWRPELAWQSLERHSYATHAATFPEVWYGIWTAPDSLYTAGNAMAGWTWQSAATPMTDFPAMNSNPPAMALLGLLRVCGIEPSDDGDGLLIEPHVPRDRFVLDTALLKLDVEPGQIGGEYRAVTEGSRMLYIRVPDKAVAVVATVNGSDVTADTDSEGRIALRLEFQTGEAVMFEVRWEAEPTPPEAQE